MRVRVFSTRDRRAATIGILVIGGLLCVGRGLPALRQAEQEWQTRGERAALMLQRATRLRTEAARPRLLSERSSRALYEAAIAGPTPVAAAAAAMAHISELTQVLGGTLLSARPEGDVAFRDGSASIVLHLQLTLGADGLRELLVQLESAPKLFRVRTITVSADTPIAATAEPEALRVELSLDAVALESVSAEGS